MLAAADKGYQLGCFDVSTFEQHAAVQGIAKLVLSELGPTLSPLDSEYSIMLRAKHLLASRGVTETWYYDCPVFVLLGQRCCLSISGRNYIPSQEPVGDFNVISVDLSPQLNGVWGDCARTFLFEHGAYTATPETAEFMLGIKVELMLHQAILSFATPSTTFDELFTFGNSEIRRLGFENLDFHGNLGHSIESHRDDRLYIESCARSTLGEVAFFTFEPHIRKVAVPGASSMRISTTSRQIRDYMHSNSSVGHLSPQSLRVVVSRCERSCDWALCSGMLGDK